MRALPLASVALSGLVALSACTQAPPPGPSFLAQPGKGKSIQQFQAEDQRCRSYAAQANGNVTPAQAAANSGVSSAVAGTLIGAAAGALLGAATHNPGAGAAFGAGGGLLIGSAYGANSAQRSGAAYQANYDNAYAQCTRASGNLVPPPPGYGPPGYGPVAPPPPPPGGYAY